ncbi:MAG TPA: glycosyltransferase [Thermomicrobiales bacterium]
MHILLCTIGSAGDVHPLLGIGLALRARGHEATVVTNPYFADRARRLGLGFIPLGAREDYERVVRSPDLWHPTRGFQVIASRMIAPNVEPLYEIIARHDPQRTVVFAAGTCFGARIAQEHLGVRLLTHHLAPALLWSRVRPPLISASIPAGWPRAIHLAFHRLGVRIVDRALAPQINAFRQRFGLAQVRDLLYGWANSPDGVLGLFPDWFAAPQPDWPRGTQLTGFTLYDPPTDGENIPTLRELFGTDTRPLIFTPGSANIHARQFFAAAIEASQSLGRPALLLTRYRDQLPAALPAGIVHRDYIPLDALLSQGAALIHHGGIGTTAQGLAAGIPHLVMPMSHDQPDNAERLRQLGVGVSVAPAQFTGTRVADALDRLLHSPTVLQRSNDLAVRCDPVAARGAVVEALEQLAGCAR